MTPGTVSAIAYLLVEALDAGVAISSIIAEAQATGRIPPEKWDEVLADLDAEAAKWRSSRGLGSGQ